MSMRITFDLTESDLKHFKKAMTKASGAMKALEPDVILSQAKGVLKDVAKAKTPDFISERIEKLRMLIAMLEDEGWGLEQPERGRVLSALAYFADPEDLIPDNIPGLGYLDDAIMIELICRELKPEIEAYDDFCVFRKAEGTRRGEKVNEMAKADWMQSRRKELHSRMRRRRRSSRGSRRSSGGSVSGFSLFK